LRNETVVSYDEMDELWRHFNRAYIVVYPPEREAEVALLVGLDWDVSYNARHAFDLAISEAQARPTDFFAWFNVGSSNALLGQYQDASLAFDHAFNLIGQELPHRILWYEFAPYEAYYNAGRFDQLLNLITYSLDTSKGDVEELFYWRGMVSAARGDMVTATADFDTALAYNQFFTPAAVARAQVQDGSFVAPQAES
jgi:tetratricopeptide (TPR) repeat protein